MPALCQAGSIKALMAIVLHVLTRKQFFSQSDYKLFTSTYLCLHTT